LQFIDSLLAGDKYHCPVAERVDGGECGPNPTHRQLQAANEWLLSTLLSGGSNSAVYVHQILSLGK
jgi:hypothetical protein